MQKKCASHPVPLGGGWTECGSIDSLGHSLQIGLVHQLLPELERIAERVASLLQAGWHRVRVVTDHGWLLLPGGLPKVELAPYLTETKWARCARVKGQPDLNFQWPLGTGIQTCGSHRHPELRASAPAIFTLTEASVRRSA